MRLLLFQLLAATLFSACATSADAPRKNFVFILGDDINRDQLGPYGGQTHTPHLDQLAADGMRFDRAYVNVAMCASFRQELYSGRTTWRTRTMLNHSHSVEGTRSIPQFLQPLGYKVGLLGKSHIGPKTCYPFDSLGDVSKKEDANPEMMDRARAYIGEARKAGAPFCLFIGSHDGHAPFTTGDVSQYDPASLSMPPYWKDTPVMRTELAKHMAEVTNLDALLGMMRAYLKEAGLEKDTVLVFCSEQGNQFPFAKWTCFDNGLHTGLIASCPGTIPAGEVCEELLWIADIAPTFVEAAGGDFAAEDFDGRSQWANFAGAGRKVHDYAYGAFSNKGIIDNRERIYPIRVVRDKRYTLIWSPAHEGQTSNVTLSRALAMVNGDKPVAAQDPASSFVAAAGEDPGSDTLVRQLHRRPEWALYDRQKDRHELDNLVSDPEHAEVLKRLRTELDTWLTRWDDADPVATEKALTTNHGGGKGKKKQKVK